MTQSAPMAVASAVLPRRLLTRAGTSRRVLVLGGAAIAAGIVAWLLPMRDSAGFGSPEQTLVVSLLFLLAGLLAAARRPDTVTGALLVLFAVLSALGFGVREVFEPWRYTVGLVFDDTSTVVLAILVLIFPTGRLEQRWDRWLAWAFAVVICGTKPFEVIWSAPAALCATCPPAGNLLYAAAPPFDFADALEVRADVRILLIGLVLVSLAWRFARASRAAKRLMAPLVVTSWLLAAKVVADQLYLVDRILHGDQFPAWFQTPNFLLFAAIPAAYLGGMLQTRVTRSTIGRLVADLGRGPQTGPLRDLLARALGDPTLRVGFWADAQQTYVDAEGRLVELPAPQERAHVSHVTGDGGPLAVLIHDPALLEDPGLVDAVAGAARLALENEALRAQVRAQLEQVSQSRARIVAAADEERRRLERDLHDGAQQRLVSLAMALRLIRAQAADPERVESLLTRAETEAHAAVDELRDLARGIHPAVLSDEGLGAALESLADRSTIPVQLATLPPGRLPAAVEAAAYFTCSEAVTNAVKHAGATRVRIDAAVRDGALRLEVADDGAGGATLEGGTGLRGLADRVEALGGTLEIDSPAGKGTRLRANLQVSGR